MRGLIPTIFVQYFENKSYTYALEKGYIPENP
jgi:patatin-like phospholipase/acyl hydrolase